MVGGRQANRARGTKCRELILCGHERDPKHRMTVDRYFAWAERRPGRFELLDGAVYEMSPETAGHAKNEGRNICSV